MNVDETNYERNEREKRNKQLKVKGEFRENESHKDH